METMPKHFEDEIDWDLTEEEKAAGDDQEEKSCVNCGAVLKGGTIECPKCHTMNSSTPPFERNYD